MKNIYFLGVGGIGMSGLARYFRHEGRVVGGYDRTKTPLTQELENEGVEIHYLDNRDNIPSLFRDPKNTTVIYTPAIPSDSDEMAWFKEHNFEIIKRSQALGEISKGKFVMAVAGTHGKTSTTTMIAWFNHIAAKDAENNTAINSDSASSTSDIGGGSAFLGGISKNFGSNMVLGCGERLAVEADEFDRSFLRLYPDMAVVTATDADHLDIYGTHEALKDAFSQFTAQIKPGGALVYRYGCGLKPKNDAIKIYTYSLDNVESDFYAKNISIDSCGLYTFDIVSPVEIVEKCTLGIPGHINVENCVGAASLLLLAGCDRGKLREAIASFAGVKRRFDFYINTPKLVYMDDYAHHPDELAATISSLREMFPGRSIGAVFQPHLYTRTRDFADGFINVLSRVDKLVMIPIYPARELPIEGISSDMIIEKAAAPWKKMVSKEELVDTVSNLGTDIVVTFGAGDIDAFCAPIAERLKQHLE